MSEEEDKGNLPVSHDGWTGGTASSEDVGTIAYQTLIGDGV